MAHYAKLTVYGIKPRFSHHYDDKEELLSKLSAYFADQLRRNGQFSMHVEMLEDKEDNGLGF